MDHKKYEKFGEEWNKIARKRKNLEKELEETRRLEENYFYNYDSIVRECVLGDTMSYLELLKIIFKNIDTNLFCFKFEDKYYTNFWNSGNVEKLPVRDGKKALNQIAEKDLLKKSMFERDLENQKKTGYPSVVIVKEDIEIYSVHKVNILNEFLINKMTLKPELIKVIELIRGEKL